VVRAGHNRYAAEAAYRVEDAGIIGGNDDAGDAPGLPRAFINVLNQRLTGVGGERFSGKTGRGVSGRNDGNRPHRPHLAASFWKP
jgi:hypothetical protein